MGGLGFKPVFSLLEAEPEDRVRGLGRAGGGELRLNWDKVLKVLAKSLQTHEKYFAKSHTNTPNTGD